jgi:hypothetical protein
MRDAQASEFVVVPPVPEVAEIQLGASVNPCIYGNVV